MAERVVEILLALFLTHLAAAITEDVKSPHERHGMKVARGCHGVSAAACLPRLLGCCERQEGERQEGDEGAGIDMHSEWAVGGGGSIRCDEICQLLLPVLKSPLPEKEPYCANPAYSRGKSES